MALAAGAPAAAASGRGAGHEQATSMAPRSAAGTTPASARRAQDMRTRNPFAPGSDGRPPLALSSSPAAVAGLKRRRLELLAPSDGPQQSPVPHQQQQEAEQHELAGTPVGLMGRAASVPPSLIPPLPGEPGASPLRLRLFPDPSSLPARSPPAPAAAQAVMEPVHQASSSAAAPAARMAGDAATVHTGRHLLPPFS